jgi:glycosyltransferase involved in cell wall biosynthesis
MPESSPTLSVIITTFDEPENLGLVLRALARQDTMPDEVLIADDGSSDANVDTLRQIAEELPFRNLLHIWQPDDEFRASRSRNNAVHESSGEILLFLDQDTMPHRDWISTHLRHLKPRNVNLGSVLNLTEEQAARLSVDSVSSGAFETLHGPECMEILRRRQRSYVTYALLRRAGIGIKNRPTLRSCNVAAWREDLVRVNGFDEAYVGWGQEDNDLGRRLYMSGVRPIGLVDKALVSHIPHPRRYTEWKEGTNLARYRKKIAHFACEAGLTAHPYADVKVTKLRTE